MANLAFENRFYKQVQQYEVHGRSSVSVSCESDSGWIGNSNVQSPTTDVSDPVASGQPLHLEMPDS